MASTTEKPECAGYLMLREKDPWMDESLRRAACHGEVTWEVEGKNYCLMHAPTTDKAEEFEKALKNKLATKDYNFCGVWFPGYVKFEGYNFNSEVNFSLAVFGGYANFSRAQFSGGDAHFSKARFSHGNDFIGAKFRGGKADFSETQFDGGKAYFSKAQFSGGKAYFREAEFSGGPANFGEAQFSGGDAEFNYAQFSGGYADFERAQFSGGNAEFNSAQFSGGNAFFNKAEFGGGNTYFNKAQFGGKANFDKAQFSGGNASFRAAQFSKTAGFSQAVFAKLLDFGKAVFEKQVFFDRSEFKAGSFTNFRLARFIDFVRLMDLKIEKGAEVYFGQATFEKPERVHFHSVELSPRWFISLDIRKFNFESVVFPLLKKRSAAVWELERTQQLLKQLKEIRGEEELLEPAPPAKLLITAYHRLAANAEENNRYEEAMDFRYLAMETKRHSGWWRRFLPVTLHWWYWASSGYGERAWRAAAMLMLVWLIPFLFYLSTAALFTRVETKRDEEVPGAAEYHVSNEVPGMPASEAVLYSLNTMAFQKPEPKASKTSALTQWIVFAQTILGPLQAALLALAIRRKFMR